MINSFIVDKFKVKTCSSFNLFFFPTLFHSCFPSHGANKLKVRFWFPKKLRKNKGERNEREKLKERKKSRNFFQIK